MLRTSVLVAGGGLSGCLVAHGLSLRGIDCRLIEARDRLGGRILSPLIADVASEGALDLGPSWFWPHQRGMLDLIHSLGLAQNVYEQSHQGQSVIEYASGQLEHRTGAVSMAGSYRIEGGMQALIDRIRSAVPSDTIQLSTSLTGFNESSNAVTAEIQTAEGTELVECRFLVLALPPRLLAARLGSSVGSRQHLGALESVATWMATEAKVALVYDSPFWLEQGLSGDAMSQIGPLGEIHAATPRNSSKSALFGFVSTRAPQRQHKQAIIEQQAVAQIQRMFNTSITPSRILYKDWSYDEFTATNADQTGVRAHPSSALLQQEQKRVIWAVSEAAPQDAGYLEGAVIAANAATNSIFSTPC